MVAVTGTGMWSQTWVSMRYKYSISLIVIAPKTPALYYLKKAGWQCAKKDDE